MTDTTGTAARRRAEAAGATSSCRTSRDELVDRFFELQPQMQRRFNLGIHRELRDELHSVTVHQLGVLLHLRAGTLTMRELAKELDVSESAATAVTDRLVRQDLVVRQDDPSDRRIVRLALSAAGATLVTKLHETACRKTASLLSVLSDRQLAQLISIMETLEAADPPGDAELAPPGRPTTATGVNDTHSPPTSTKGTEPPR